jgi:hypothetical protein
MHLSILLCFFPGWLITGTLFFSLLCITNRGILANIVHQIVIIKSGKKGRYYICTSVCYVLQAEISRFPARSMTAKQAHFRINVLVKQYPQ